MHVRPAHTAPEGASVPGEAAGQSLTSACLGRVRPQIVHGLVITVRVMLSVFVVGLARAEAGQRTVMVRGLRGGILKVHGLASGL